jgi:hypothetical protein
VRPMLSVSLDCPFLIDLVLFVFVLCLVRPMLSVSMDCPFLIALHLSLTFIPYIDKISTFQCFFIKKTPHCRDSSILKRSCICVHKTTPHDVLLKRSCIWVLGGVDFASF